jgi:hypothetical protein
MTDNMQSKQEMTRGELGREHFEAYRDLEWVERIEPGFRKLDASPEAMGHYREAWNVFTEDRDWEHWRNEETRRTPNEELKAEVAWYKAELKALHMRRSVLDKANAGQPSFKEIVNGQVAPRAAQPVQVPALSIGR